MLRFMMIIKDVRLRRTGRATVLSARCRIRKIGWDTVEFSTADDALGECIHDDASPFAAVLLLASMKQGEDLIIEGSISEQLYKGMHAVMHEVLSWDIGLKPIKIKAGALGIMPCARRALEHREHHVRPRRSRGNQDR
jgi:hypothetical protein